MKCHEFDILVEYLYLYPAIIQTERLFIATSTISMATFQIIKHYNKGYEVYVEDGKEKDWVLLGYVASVISIFGLVDDYDFKWMKTHKRP